MPNPNRRTVIATGPALLTGSAFATIGAGSGDDTEADEERSGATDDTAFTAEPHDGWYAFRADAGSTRAVSAANEPDAPDAVRWRHDDIESRDGIAIGDERVYRHDGTGRIRALDPTDGSVAWTSDDLGVDDAPNSAPVVVGDWLYVGGEALTALDADTGEVRWRRAFGDGDDSPTVYQPEFAHGTIYASTDDERLYAVDPADGSVRWERHSIDEIDEGDHPYWSYDTFHAYSLAVTTDAVYATVGTPPEQRQVVALEPESGETLWTVHPNGTLRARVAATENYVFVYDASTTFETRVVDATTGDVLNPISGGGPAAIAQDTFVGTVGGNELRATDVDATEDRWITRWVRDDAQSYGTPTIAGDTVLVVALDERDREFLKGFDLESGRERWCLHLEAVPQLANRHGDLRYDLAVDDGTIYLSGDEEQVAIR
ncbi:PQQ-binding-like beta-propeller repeat protein [Halosolutus gelatinilyticus]|uniref:PQQ-binding-like beta-propeller repeat protein n=1 Tax=Halosolutus gelatinilyticus TaxID=2931975 RepID=UPI001FF3A0E1|nr:PQQ-binding-like beta-propeller repeat protein [Halosolutus gelatinilyticus]